MDLELDMSDDEEAAAERQLSGAGATGGHRTLAGGRYEAIPMFSDDVAVDEDSPANGPATARGDRRPLDVDRNKGRDGISEGDQDVWDRLG